MRAVQRILFAPALRHSLGCSSVRHSGGGSGQPDWKAATRERGLSDFDLQEIMVWRNPKAENRWYYREPLPPPPAFERNVTYFLSAFIWFWVIYRLYYDYDLVIGEFFIPDPQMFTDAELGIPPDDVD